MNLGVETLKSALPLVRPRLFQHSLMNLGVETLRGFDTTPVQLGFSIL